MEKIIGCFFLIIILQNASAQVGISNRAKQAVKNKVNQKMDEKIDKGIDKSINKMDTIITGNGQKGKPNNSSGVKTTAPVSVVSNNVNNASQTSTAIKANSKFDFVPGEKIIGAEDFSQDAVGDFPDKWNTNSSGEVVTIDGQKGKWLALKKPGIFYPEFINSLPENFTLEYDIIASNNYSQGSASFEINIIKVSNENDLKIIVNNSGDRFRPSNNTNGITIKIHPNEYGDGSYFYRTIENGSEQLYHSNKQNIFTNANNTTHISIWKQKTRIRMYLNQEKIIDLPKAMTDKYNRIIFSPNYSYNNDEDMLYLTNLRLAAGNADTRNKLITEGKFVTHGILFEPGSDKINPQSYGTLKEIAAVLNENETVKVNIVGHTDSDGDEVGNLTLSKKRAEAVKNTLVNDFSITVSRIQTSGKGETVPIEPNTTQSGKANNRRVEFIKQ